MPTFRAESVRQAHPTGRHADEWLIVPLGRRVRAVRDGACVVDSRAPLLVWEPGGQVPRYGFAAADLSPAVRDAATTLDELDGGSAPVHAVPWDQADAWFEEDTRVHVHPRDPFHRIDLRASSRHVVVEVGGEVVADTCGAVMLFETGLPTRHYVPRLDVRMEMLTPSPTVTRCAYKGEASHWHVRIDGRVHPDACWTYPWPAHEYAGIADRICFYHERSARIIVDGEPVEDVATQWSAGG